MELELELREVTQTPKDKCYSSQNTDGNGLKKKKCSLVYDTGNTGQHSGDGTMLVVF